MKYKKLPFHFGDWVQWNEVVKFKHYRDYSSHGYSERVMERSQLYCNKPQIGKVVGITYRHEGSLQHYYDEGTSFTAKNAIMVVQVKRSLTSKIQECLPDQLSKPCLTDTPYSFPDRIIQYNLWSEEDKKDFRKQVAKIKRDSKGRFMKYDYREGKEECIDCKGTGWDNSEDKRSESCYTCGGTGYVKKKGSE